MHFSNISEKRKIFYEAFRKDTKWLLRSYVVKPELND